MVHASWRPTRGLVTGFADICAVNMATRQAVAAGARAGAIHLRVIHRKDWRPTGSAVTGFAKIRGVDVAVR